MKRPNRKDYVNNATKNKLIADLELYIEYLEKPKQVKQVDLKYKTRRGDDLKTVPYIHIELGEDRFRITRSITGGLIINKATDGDNEDITVKPNVSNQITIK